MATEITLDKLTIGNRLNSNTVDSKNILVGGKSVKRVLGELPSFNDKVIVTINGKTYELYGIKVQHSKPNTIDLNGVEYTSFVQALNNLTSGTNQLKLLGDCNMDEMDTVGGNILPKIKKSLVLDLNGFTLTDTNVFTYQDGSTTRKVLFDYGWESQYGMRLTFELKNGTVNTTDIRLLSFNSLMGSVNIHDISGTSVIDDNYYINVFNANTVNMTNCDINLSSKREVLFVEPLVREMPSIVTVKDNKINYVSTTDASKTHHNSVFAVGQLATLSTDNNIISAQGEYLHGIYSLYNTGYTAIIGHDTVDCDITNGVDVIFMGINGWDESQKCIVDVTVDGLNIIKNPNGRTMLVQTNEGGNVQIVRTDILDGTFNDYSVGHMNTDDQSPVIVPLTIENYEMLKIKGGTFSKEITTQTNLADGYVCVQDGNMWIVRPE